MFDFNTTDVIIVALGAVFTLGAVCGAAFWELRAQAKIRRSLLADATPTARGNCIRAVLTGQKI